VNWNGRRYEITFNNRTGRLMEDVYAEYYGHPEIGLYDILVEIDVPKHRALMAAAYASIRAGGGEVEWEDFDQNFNLGDIEGMREAVQGAILEALPTPEPEEDGPKNAPAPTDRTPTNQTGSRGRS
jgi:hypothetical protein